MLKGNKKRLVSTLAHRMVDSNAIGVSTSKAQHDCATGKVKRAKKIRDEPNKRIERT